MNVLAIIVVASFGIALLPGSPWLPPKPKIDWNSPHIYLNLARELAALALAIWIVVA